MLIEIKDYIQLNGSASILDISNRFRIPPDALRGMLAHWIDKGAIRRFDSGNSCDGCTVLKDCRACSLTTSIEFYEWAGSDTSKSATQSGTST